MENIPRWLVFTIDLLLTMAIISMLVSLWNIGQMFSDMTNRQGIERAQAAEYNQYAAFDHQAVTGAQIQTAYRRYSDNYAFSIYVQTAQGTTRNFAMQPSERTYECPAFDYNSGTVKSGTENCNVTVKQTQTYGGPYYIPPQSRYESELVVDANNRVSGIYFKAH